MYSKDNENNENFWISYADLMAGLLFVFILVIGAIIIKYLFTQTDLQAIKADLVKEKQALNMSEEELSAKKKVLNELNIKLQKANEEKTHLSFELAKSKNQYNDIKKELELTKEESKKLDETLSKNKKELQLSLEQIEKITAILEDKENNISLLNRQIKQQEGTIKENLKKISLNLEELEKLKALLLDYEITIKKNNEDTKKLNTTLDEKTNLIKLKDEELVQLEKKLVEQIKSHQSLVEEFDITKSKIKHLTGIKITVISKLKEKLGDSINIDTKSGTIKLSSNILFGQGEFNLKEDSKKELKSILKKYFDALLKDNDIKQYIQSITIEGHTNSDGSYIDNLELSQQRALELMKFIYSSNIVDKKILNKYVNASGRSYADRIFKNGVEDKNLSRRIEIKFLIKNEATLNELQNFLDKK